MIYFKFVLTGTKGMNKAVWRKLENHKYSFIHQAVLRDMDNWEVCLVNMGSDYLLTEFTNDTPHAVFTKILGPRLIKKYSIQIN